MATTVWIVFAMMMMGWIRTAQCQTACTSNPCQNGGNCTDLVNGFNCTCPLPFFVGIQCEQMVNCSIQPDQIFVDPDASPSNPFAFGTAVLLTDHYLMMLSTASVVNTFGQTPRIWITHYEQFAESGHAVQPLSSSITCIGASTDVGIECGETFVAVDNALAWLTFVTDNDNGPVNAVVMYEPDINKEFMVTQILPFVNDQFSFGNVIAITYNKLFIHVLPSISSQVLVYNRTRLTPFTSTWTLYQTIMLDSFMFLEAMSVNSNETILALTVSNGVDSTTNLLTYIYQTSTSTYVFQQNIVVQNPPAAASSMSSNENQIAIGYSGISMVQVYTLDSNHNLLPVPQTLVEPNFQPSAQCGTSVSVSNHTLLVGCPQYSTQIKRGQVTRYYRDPSDGITWNVATRYNEDCIPIDAEFGISVSTFNDIVLIGDDQAISGQGAAFLYETPCDNGGNQTCADLGGTCVNDVTQVNNFTCIGIPTNVCLSNVCLNGGTCEDTINGFICHCASGFSGVLCQTNINECSSHPCQNGGTCNTTFPGYSCTCVDGFSGANCESQIDECASNPCQNGATCLEQITSGYVCACPPANIIGVLCETIDCANHTLYSCDSQLDFATTSNWYVTDPFSGTVSLIGSMVNLIDCDGIAQAVNTSIVYVVGLDPTASFYVLASVDDPTTGVATAVGLTGMDVTYDLKFRPLLQDNRLFGLTLDDNTGLLALTTFDLGSGAATIIGSTGLNGQGNAIVFSLDGLTLYAAIGASLYTIDIDTAAPTFLFGLSGAPIDDCLNNGGTPYLSAFGRSTVNAMLPLAWFRCIISFPPPAQLVTVDLTTGTVTAIGAVNTQPLDGLGEVTVNLCQNNGTCSFNTSTCQCPANNLFTGPLCETTVVPTCVSQPCQQGGTCVEGLNSYTCICPPGFTGAQCQTLLGSCSSFPCQHGATCTDLPNAFVCTCLPGFSGRRCQTDIDECNSSPCTNGATCVDAVNGYECEQSACFSNPCQNSGTCSVCS